MNNQGLFDKNWRRSFHAGYSPLRVRPRITVVFFRHKKRVTDFSITLI